MKYKTLLMGGLFMLGSNIVIAGDIFEIVTFKFKENVSMEDQKKALEKLNTCVKKYEGFKSREYYFSKDSNTWVDSVVWTSSENAKKAAEQVMKDPEAGKIFSMIDDKSIVFSHYERVGGIRK
ncbi:hypothetical protein [Bacteriovorax sp. Seq25_V]|uniref:hypothetical protein n=1 Tax=Bacteriovorax sp. Seq25_V TaxID=1201288 RepID=UPI00038A3BBC|nr:hypothetical protein [Bacteriovorax sp. Seq25_V]EQC47384.1 hypothetical protein M900_0878 [Bacteriovorax sp. Seq25_V]